MKYLTTESGYIAFQAYLFDSHTRSIHQNGRVVPPPPFKSSAGPFSKEAVREDKTIGDKTTCH